MKQTKKSPKKSNKKFPARLVIIAGVAILLVAQLAFDARILWNQHHPTDTGELTNMILLAVNGLSKPAPVDAASGKVYVPAARLVWPADPTTTAEMEYQNLGGSGTHAQLLLTTNVLKNSMAAQLWQTQSSTLRQPGDDASTTALFHKVGGLQACSRAVAVYFSQPSTLTRSQVAQGSKRLQDGRTAYFYTDSKCPISYQQLLNYVKQVDSY